MKILQLNIWGGRLFRQITDLIEKEQPDIICLQEVYSGEGGDFGVLETIEEMQEVTPGYELFFSKLYGISLMHREVSFGNSILSKFPIEKKETFLQMVNIPIILILRFTTITFVIFSTP